MESLEAVTCGAWTLQLLPSVHARPPLRDARLLHATLAQPVLAFVGGAFVLRAAAFVGGTHLHIDLTTALGAGSVPVRIDLARGEWTTPANNSAQSVARLQEQFGSRGAVVAPWPVAPPPPAAASQASAEAPPGQAPAGAAVPLDVAPAAEGAKAPGQALQVHTADGRWTFVLVPSEVCETDGAGVSRPHYHARLVDNDDGAVVVDTALTGDLVWRLPDELQIRRSFGDDRWLGVSLQRATFWRDSWREPMSSEFPLQRLPAALAR